MFHGKQFMTSALATITFRVKQVKAAALHSAVFIFAMLMDKFNEINMLSINRVALAIFIITAIVSPSRYYPAVIITFAVCILLEKVIATVAVKWNAKTSFKGK